MKKANIFFIAAIALITVVSCTKETEMEEVTGSEAGVSRTITVAFDSSTKTDIRTDLKVAFIDGDKIKVCNSSKKETCTVSVKDGHASFTTTLAGNLTAAYPASALSLNSKTGEIILNTVPPYKQSGEFNCGHIAKATIASGSTKAVFKNQAALLIVTPPAGTAQLTVTSVNGVQISDGEIIEGGYSEEAKKTIVVGDGNTELGTCYVSINAGVKLSELNFSTPISQKTVSSTTETKTGVAYTITDKNWSDPALPGVFSVSKTKKVRFSQGNLQATYDGFKYVWGLAANQYDYTANTSGNTTIDSQTAGKIVDLFGRSTANTNYGICTSTSPDDYVGDFVDWGKTVCGDSGVWRVLTENEWRYLLNNGSYANESRDGLFARGVTVVGRRNCLILYPDGYTGEKVSNGDYNTYKTAEAWAAAQKAGVVCLPAAHFRQGSTVNSEGGTIGYCWSSDNASGNYMYGISFQSSSVYLGESARLHYEEGYSVRLVTAVE